MEFVARSREYDSAPALSVIMSLRYRVEMAGFRFPRLRPILDCNGKSLDILILVIVVVAIFIIIILVFTIHMEEYGVGNEEVIR